MDTGEGEWGGGDDGGDVDWGADAEGQGYDRDFPSARSRKRTKSGVYTSGEC